MRVLVVALMVLSTLSAGCTSLTGCLSEEDARQRYDAGTGWLDNLGEDAFTMQIEGTIEGEIDTVTISADPEDETLLVQSAGYKLVVEYPWYSIESDEDELYGYSRDFDPGQHPKALLAELFAEDDIGVSFAADLGFQDYTYECVTIGEVEAVRFTYDSGTGRTDQLAVPKTGEAYIVSGQSVDPALQDNFRFYGSLDEPRIKVDETLDRLALTVDWSDLEYTAVDGGYVGTAILGTQTEWVPLQEIQLALVDEDTWEVYSFYEIDEGEWEIEEGYYIYDDKDGNGWFSAGDYLEVGMLDGYDFDIYDEWADDLAYSFGLE